MSAYADCAGCGKRIRARPDSKPGRMCRPCAVEAGRYRRGAADPEHGTWRRYSYKRFMCRCAPCCAAMSAHMRDYSARKKAETGKSPWQIWQEKLDAAGRIRTRTGAYAFECHYCGAEFRADYKAAKYCCREHYFTAEHGEERHRRVSYFYVHADTRMAIYEGDAYMCQLCGEPTEPGSDFRSGRYPSLDHIVPLSKWPEGLPGRDDPGNLRTAHRVCNSARGNRADVHHTKAPVTH